jgi:hypothetical protein
MAGLNWLDTKSVSSSKRQFCSFEEARSFALNLKFKGKSDWFKFTRGDYPEKGDLPLEIPSNPQRTYASQGWPAWLGTGRSRGGEAMNKKT